MKSAWLEVAYSCVFTLSTSDEPRNALSHLPNLIKSIMSLMEDPENAPDCASTVQKISMCTLRHLTEIDLQDQGIGSQILTELMVGTSYNYGTVMDSSLDCIASFYAAIQDKGLI